MDKPLIMVSSVTYAMQGKELLRQYGIKSEIERTPKNMLRQGCGYSLRVLQRADEAEMILRDNGIKVLGRTERSRKP